MKDNKNHTYSYPGCWSAGCMISNFKNIKKHKVYNTTRLVTSDESVKINRFGDSSQRICVVDDFTSISIPEPSILKIFKSHRVR